MVDAPHQAEGGGERQWFWVKGGLNPHYEPKSTNSFSQNPSVAPYCQQNEGQAHKALHVLTSSLYNYLSTPQLKHLEGRAYVPSSSLYPGPRTGLL